MHFSTHKAQDDKQPPMHDWSQGAIVLLAEEKRLFGTTFVHVRHSGAVYHGGRHTPWADFQSSIIPQQGVCQVPKRASLERSVRTATRNVPFRIAFAEYPASKTDPVWYLAWWYGSP